MSQRSREAENARTARTTFAAPRRDLPKGPKVVPFWDYLINYRILNMNPQKELLWGLWVGFRVLWCLVPEGDGHAALASAARSANPMDLGFFV